MATFGKTSDGAGSSASSLDKMFVSSASPASSGTITSATARDWLSATGSTSSVAVIYSDVAGSPTTLLATSDTLTVNNTTEQANTYTFSGVNQIAIVSGVTYWIGIAWQDPGTPSFTVSRDATASQRQEQSITWPTIPTTFGVPSATNSGPIDVFVTYTLASGDLNIATGAETIITSELSKIEVNSFIRQSDSATLTESINKLVDTNIYVAEAPGFNTAPSSAIDTTEDYKGIGFSGSQRKIAKDSNGRIFVGYRKKFSNIYQPYISYSDDGLSWVSVQIANIVTDDQRVPSIAIGSDNVIHVAWYGKDPSNTGTNERQIKYAHSTDNGQTYSAWISVGGDVSGYAGSSLWQEHPCIFVDPSNPNNLYVVWEGRDASNLSSQQIKFSKSTNGGSTWSTWANISGSGSRPAIVKTTDGKLHVVFYSATGTTGSVQQVQHVFSSNEGSSWSSNSIIGDTGFDGRHVSLINDGNNLHIVWRMTNSTYNTTQIHYSLYNGSWSTPTTISPRLNLWQFFPHIGVVSGEPIALWFEANQSSLYPSDDPTNGLVYISRYHNNLWTTAQQLTYSGTDLYPYINKNSLDTIYSSGLISPFSINYLGLTSFDHSVAISESNSLSVTAPAIAVSDIIVTNESLNQTVADNASTSDTTIISESLAHYSDQIDTIERINIVLIGNVPTADTITTNESLQLLIIARVNTSDSIILSENTQLFITKFVNSVDTIVTNEFVGVLRESAISASDNTTINESITVLTQILLVSTTDTATISEVIRLNTSAEVILSDAFTGTEGIQVTSTISVNTQDDIALFEALIINSKSVSVSDSSNIAESLSYYSDQIDMMELVIVDIARPDITTSDTISLNESINLVVINSVLDNDTVTFIESTNITQVYSIPSNDITTFGESIKLLNEYTVAASDVVIFSENKDVTKASSRDIIISDNRLLDEAGDFILDENGNFIYDENPSEFLFISESVSISRVYGISVSDTLTVSESISITYTIPGILVSDTVTSNESIFLNDTANIAINEILISTESIRLLNQNNIATSDSATLTESVFLLILSLFISVSESLATNEANLLLPAGGIGILDSLALSESNSVYINTAVFITDLVTTLEGTNPNLVNNITTSDSLSFVESKTLTLVSLAFASDSMLSSEDISIVILEASPDLVSLYDDLNTVENIKAMIAGFIAVSDTLIPVESIDLVDTPLSILIIDLVNINESTVITQRNFIPRLTLLGIG